MKNNLNNNSDTELKHLNSSLLNILGAEGRVRRLIRSDTKNFQYDLLINSKKCAGFPFFVNCSRYKSSFFVSNASFREHKNRVMVEPLAHIKRSHKLIVSSLSIFYMPSLKFVAILSRNGIDWMRGLQILMEDEQIMEDDLVYKLHGDTPSDVLNQFSAKFSKSVDYQRIQNNIGDSFYVDEASVLTWKNAIFSYRTSAIRYTKSFSPTTRILFSNSIIQR